MQGFRNRLLRINPGKRSFHYETIPDEILARTLGGKGLGTALLLAENPPGVDPLSPESRFILTTGPATGTSIWGQSRFGAFAKSPATALYRKYGTPMQVAITNGQNCFPTRYWQSGRFSKWENLSAEYMVENFEVAAHPCPDCFLQCTKLCRVRRGRHTGLLPEEMDLMFEEYNAVRRGR